MRSRSELASGRGAFFTGPTRAEPEDDDPAPPEGRAKPERLTSVSRPSRPPVDTTETGYGWAVSMRSPMRTPSLVVNQMRSPSRSPSCGPVMVTLPAESCALTSRS